MYSRVLYLIKSWYWPSGNILLYFIVLYHIIRDHGVGVLMGVSQQYVKICVKKWVLC